MISFQRYYYYIEDGIDPSMVAEPDPKHLQQSLSLIHPRFQGILKSKHKDHVALVKSVLLEIQKDYEFSIRKAIGSQQLQ